MKQKQTNSISLVTKFEQIVQNIIKEIDSRKLRKGDKLLSINELSSQLKVSRDTVEKAYKLLKELGFIISISSKGYFVAGVKTGDLRILLVVNKLSYYKKIVYESLVSKLGVKATIDLSIHHYRIDLLKKILEEKNGNYHYYLVMPHFETGTTKEECIETLKIVQDANLILLDKDVEELGENRKGVVQNFRNDIYNILTQHALLIQKYQTIVLVMSHPNNHPKEIELGITKFCVENKKSVRLINNISDTILRKKTLYIFAFESDLAVMIKKVRHSSLQLGKDIGILSFNETVFKELLGITVVSTDFNKMGETAANIILHKTNGIIQNPFKLIDRGSV